MARSAVETRSRLLEAAERLFAERGIDGVSLREINQAAGARNAIALQYHFKDRSGMLAAILAKHHPDVEARRHALLDEYEAGDSGNVRLLAAALVRPMAAKPRVQSDVLWTALPQTIDLAARLTSTSRASSRCRQAASTRPAGSTVTMSLAECTARSTVPSIRACSISLVKSPLPPTSASGRSWIVSPVVRMTIISTASSAMPRAAASRRRTICA